MLKPAPDFTATRAGLPDHVLLSVTDVCNLACVQCPHVIPGLKWGHSTVPLEKIAELVNAAKTTSLHGAGEVLMHPRWWDYVPKPPSIDHGIGFTTNGLILSPRNIELLLACKIAYLDISIDAGSPDAYRKIRGGDWESLWNGIDRLIAARPAAHPLLLANMTLMMANLHEVEKLIPMLKQRSFEALHIFHLNPKNEPDGRAWTYRFNDDSGNFNYWEQQSTLPNNLPEHDRALTRAAAAARQLGFKVKCSGSFFGRQGYGMLLNELTA